MDISEQKRISVNIRITSSTGNARPFESLPAGFLHWIQDGLSEFDKYGFLPVELIPVGN